MFWIRYVLENIQNNRTNFIWTQNEKQIFLDVEIVIGISSDLLVFSLSSASQISQGSRAWAKER
ncbi:MAG TPA: hypothetical protein DDZ90_33190, partial [Planctomycetaceae bacterium]|nr:hypothetical protein [Planctomycetaceae bacterium]